jgi:hypothetical protein
VRAEGRNPAPTTRPPYFPLGANGVVLSRNAPPILAR